MENQLVSRCSYGDDEIELIDLIRVLVKQKRMIIGVTLLTTALAVALCFILPQKYSVSFLVELGQDEQSKAIVSPQAVKVAIENDAYVDALRSQMSLNENTGLKFTIQTPKNTELLYVDYQTAQPALGLKVLQHLLELIDVDVSKKLEQKKRRISNELSLAKIQADALQQKFDLLTGQIKQQQQAVADLNKTRQGLFADSTADPVALLLYSNEVKNGFEYLNQLNDNLSDNKADILTEKVKVKMLQTDLDNLQGLYAYKKPTVSEQPISPQKPLIVALGFALGLMGSVVLAFLREYLQQHRQQLH